MRVKLIDFATPTPVLEQDPREENGNQAHFLSL